MHLRLFQDGQAAPPNPSQLSLDEYFYEFVLRDLEEQDRAKATLDDYRRHMAAWHRFTVSALDAEDDATAAQPQSSRETRQDTGEAGQAGYRTNCPVLPNHPIGAVERDHLDAFRKWCLRLKHNGKPLSNRTVNKYVGSVEKVIGDAVDRGDAARRLKLKPLPCRKAADKFYLSHGELDAIYVAMGEATWPTLDRRGKPLRYSPAAGWRCWLVWMFNYGFRTQELSAYRPGETPLTWGQLQLDDPLTPAVDGKSECEHGWFWYVPKKQRRTKDTPLVLPLNATTRWHLAAIQPPHTFAALPLFDWPYEKAFYAQWRTFCRAADVQPRRTIGGEQKQYKPCHLRKTASTWLDQHRSGIDSLILGHSAVRADESRVTVESYRNAEARILECLQTLPQPKTFRPPAVGERQLLLF